MNQKRFDEIQADFAAGRLVSVPKMVEAIEKLREFITYAKHQLDSWDGGAHVAVLSMRCDRALEEWDYKPFRVWTLEETAAVDKAAGELLEAINEKRRQRAVNDRPLKALIEKYEPERRRAQQFTEFNAKLKALGVQSSLHDNEEAVDAEDEM